MSVSISINLLAMCYASRSAIQNVYRSLRWYFNQQYDGIIKMFVQALWKKTLLALCAKICAHVYFEHNGINATLRNTSFMFVQVFLILCKIYLSTIQKHICELMLWDSLRARQLRRISFKIIVFQTMDSSNYKKYLVYNSHQSKI